MLLALTMGSCLLHRVSSHRTACWIIQDCGLVMSHNFCFLPVQMHPMIPGLHSKPIQKPSRGFRVQETCLLPPSHPDYFEFHNCISPPCIYAVRSKESATIIVHDDAGRQNKCADSLLFKDFFENDKVVPIPCTIKGQREAACTILCSAPAFLSPFSFFGFHLKPFFTFRACPFIKKTRGKKARDLAEAFL